MMNELIEKLALKAGLEICDCGLCDAPEAVSRFAELIVKECVRVVDDTFWSDPHEVDQAMDLIKKHFEIEE